MSDLLTTSDLRPGRTRPTAVEHLIVGNGPSSVLAAVALQAEGASPILISQDLLGMLRPTVSVAGGTTDPFSVVPIFPPMSHLPSLLPGESLPPLETRFFDGDAAQTPSDPNRYPPECFASFAREAGDSTLILSRKQYGDRIFREPLNGVRNKVRRSYLAGPRLSRAGFRDGLSPYVASTVRMSREIEIVDDAIVGLSSEPRKATLRSGLTVGFRHLIWTLPITHLARLVKIPLGSPPCAPAEFVASRVRAAMPTDTLIYDLRLDSPVLRCISPRPGICVAQLSMMPSVQSRDMIERLRVCQVALADIFDIPLGAFGEAEAHSYQMAYPIEPVSEGSKEMIAAACHLYGVYLFGRFATWSYDDLHELDWEGLKALAPEESA
jgi:hypothetical protein